MDSRLHSLIDDAKERRARDAESFANLDGALCMLCGAHGADKRSLFLDCGYAVHEVVPEALDIRDVAPRPERGRGYYLLICKSCRAALLGKLEEWRNERVVLRDLPKDHDGYIEAFEDDERNIPVRVNGAVQMMTRDEWDAWRSGRAEPSTL